MSQACVKWDSVVTLGLNVARRVCRSTFDPHVILKVFQHLRTDPAANRIYLSTTGCQTGFEVNDANKEIVNPLIAREIARLFGADVVRIESVEGEFIKSYSVLSSSKATGIR